MEKQTIFIIDDSDITQLLTQHTIEGLLKENVEVKCFSSAKEALAELENQAPKLVILDIVMPGMSGIDFLKQVQDQGIKVVLASSRLEYFADEEYKTFENLIGIINKPITADSIIDVIDQSKVEGLLK